MSVKRRIVIVAVLLLVAVAAAVGWRALRDGEADNGRLVMYGNVDIREVDLAFRVGGRLAELDVDEGDSVRAGDRIGRLDDEPLREDLAVIEAEIARVEAELARLVAGPRPQEIERARATVREVEAAHARAERDFRRQQGLLEQGASSEKVLEAARTLFEETRARLAAARETVDLLEEGSRTEDIAAARAALAAARAERERALTRIDDAALVSPSDGVVLTRVHEPGSMLQPGSPVVTLSLRDPVYVRAYVDEPNLGRVSPGTEVWVTSDSSDRRLRGQVGFVSPRAEFTPKSVETEDLRTDLVYRLRIVVEDDADQLLQGMPVTVEVAGANGDGGQRG